MRLVWYLSYEQAIGLAYLSVFNLGTFPILWDTICVCNTSDSRPYYSVAIYSLFFFWPNYSFFKEAVVPYAVHQDKLEPSIILESKSPGWPWRISSLLQHCLHQLHWLSKLFWGNVSYMNEEFLIMSPTQSRWWHRLDWPRLYAEFVTFCWARAMRSRKQIARTCHISSYRS